ncbi:hypothetical protein M2444_004764 [Paenibacillus sp. PastF-3]|uniref:hypothetical protein n=1 Tax=unclassified Paenibacillus TaxID=185978 RepID=UPI000BA01744|nr:MULTISPECIES: hypothetical protein [unclassified Paenibacillus]MDH6372935.1 hypothetical protein [Paenibacillus sp. PastF-3]OZQ77334.1 hypothetical protein CA598_29835 [Paenibacillus sp. VTT E-133291]
MRLELGIKPPEEGDLRIYWTEDRQAWIFHFSLPGLLPIYDQANRQLREVRKEIRDYKAELGMKIFALLQERGLEKNHPFEESFIYIVHCFPNLIESDLDNRGRKYVMDAFRSSGLLLKDSWTHLSFAEKGLYDKGNAHTEVFLAPERYASEVFLSIQKDSRIT